MNAAESKRVQAYLSSLTPFSRAVLRATSRIPSGQTRSYSQIAKAAGHPGAARAADSVLRKNQLAPLIPCHRVVKADGTPGNYSGKGGRAGKKRLLDIETRAGKRARALAKHYCPGDKRF